MSEPTLKVRYDLSGYSTIGMSCDRVADAILRGNYPLAITMDSKWGRPVDKWRAEGLGWGEPVPPVKLTEWQKGYIDALSPATPREEELLRIIEGLTPITL